MRSDYGDDSEDCRRFNWQAVIWILVLSAIFWGGLICSGRLYIP
jgi:hypothetical protein